MFATPPSQRDRPLVHGELQANGIRFHVVEAGSGPLVLLLHGFPEFWYSWRHQIGPLSEHFHVVAPDLRGYNRSEKPATGYDLKTLVDDVRGMVHALGETRAALVGHDWGGAIAWAAASRFPDVFDRLVILNAPHPTVMARHLASNPTQMRRSWYMLLFQIPGLPEYLIRRNDYALVEKVLSRNLVNRERIDADDVERYRAAIARPGALESALAYYRRAFRDALRDGFSAPEMLVRVPTQVIWGRRDSALGIELLDDLDPFVPDLRVDVIDTAGHCVQQDEPERVTELMLEFLLSSSVRRS